MAKKKKRLKNPLKAIKKKLRGKSRRRAHAPQDASSSDSSSASMSSMTPLFPQASNTPLLDRVEEEDSFDLNARSSLDEDLWGDDAASSAEEDLEERQTQPLPDWYDMSSDTELQSESLTESLTESPTESLTESPTQANVFDHYDRYYEEPDHSELFSDSESSSESSSELGGQYDSSTAWELPIDARERSVYSASKGNLDNLDVAQTDGWASIILTDAHRAADEKVGVDYSKQDEMALTLNGGSFIWSKTKKAVENPDFSGLDDKALSSKNGNFLAARSDAMAKEQGGTRTDHWEKAVQELRSDPRLIFVMTADGTFYAGESELDVLHHSSLAGGGSVTGAGEMSLSSGVPVAMNNFSGHYQPGPFSMWMVVAELQTSGVSLGNIDMELHAVTSHFQADWFYNNFDVMAPKTHKRFLPADPGEAVARMNDRLSMEPFDYQLKYHCWSDQPDYGQTKDDESDSSSESSFEPGIPLEYNGVDGYC